MDLSFVKPSQSKEIWFEDGNIVLQTESTLFKVHQGVLARHSSIFFDMFSVPQPTTDMPHEAQIVQLQDWRQISKSCWRPCMANGSCPLHDIIYPVAQTYIIDISRPIGFHSHGLPP